MLRSLVFRTLITNSGITALGLVNSVLLSRWLGPSGRGEVAAAMLWPMLLTYIGSMGLIVSIAYFTSLSESQPQVIFNTAVVVGLILSVITVPIGFALLPWLLKSQTSHVISASRLFLLVIPITLVAQFGTSILQGLLRMTEYNWLRIIIPAGYLVGTVILTALERLTLINILLLHLFLNLVVLAGVIAVLANSGIHLTFRASRTTAVHMLKHGSRLQVGQISGLANLSLDQVLIAAWLPATYLGLYVIAVSSAGLSQMFAQAVNTVAMPGISQKQSERERGAFLARVFRQYWLLSILIIFVMGATLPALIPLVFGASFKNAIWPAEILLLGSLFNGARQVLTGGAIALGKPWLTSKAHLTGFGFTVVLLCALLPLLGLIGAAIATSIAYFAELAVLANGLRKTGSISIGILFRFNLRDLNLISQLPILKNRSEDPI